MKLILQVQLAQQLHGVVSVGLFEDGVLIPDTARNVTISEADAQIPFAINRKFRVCPKGLTSISVQSIPSAVTPSDATVAIETEIPIIVNGTFNLGRTDD